MTPRPAVRRVHRRNSRRLLYFGDSLSSHRRRHALFHVGPARRRHRPSRASDPGPGQTRVCRRRPAPRRPAQSARPRPAPPAPRQGGRTPAKGNHRPQTPRRAHRTRAHLRQTGPGPQHAPRCTPRGPAQGTRESAGPRGHRPLLRNARHDREVAGKAADRPIPRILGDPHRQRLTQPGVQSETPQRPDRRREDPPAGYRGRHRRRYQSSAFHGSTNLSRISPGSTPPRSFASSGAVSTANSTSRSKPAPSSGFTKTSSTTRPSKFRASTPISAMPMSSP